VDARRSAKRRRCRGARPALRGGIIARLEMVVNNVCRVGGAVKGLSVGPGLWFGLFQRPLQQVGQAQFLGPLAQICAVQCGTLHPQHAQYVAPLPV